MQQNKFNELSILYIEKNKTIALSTEHILKY
jgi:hypothetical protein